MIVVSPIIQLRNTCDLFERRVSGAMAFLAASSAESDIDTPSCYVVPMFSTATAPPPANAVCQEVTERFATIVCASNKEDKKRGPGMGAEVQLSLAEAQLFKALLAWSPPEYASAGYTQFERSQHLFMNNARIWHQYEWTCTYYISGDPASASSAQYLAIQKVIMAGWPNLGEFNSQQLAKLFVPSSPAVGPFSAGILDTNQQGEPNAPYTFNFQKATANISSEVRDSSQYKEVMELFTSQPPPWVRQASTSYDRTHQDERWYLQHGSISGGGTWGRYTIVPGKGKLGDTP